MIKMIFPEMKSLSVTNFSRFRYLITTTARIKSFFFTILIRRVLMKGDIVYILSWSNRLFFSKAADFEASFLCAVMSEITIASI